MNTYTLDTLSDPELIQVIATAQGLLQSRAEKRRGDAMEHIRQIAVTVQLNVSFDGRKAQAVKTALKAGECFVNPEDATQRYVVGKGKPPRWFAALRERNKLPTPVDRPRLKE